MNHLLITEGNFSNGKTSASSAFVLSRKESTQEPSENVFDDKLARKPYSDQDQSCV